MDKSTSTQPPAKPESPSYQSSEAIKVDKAKAVAKTKEKAKAAADAKTANAANMSVSDLFGISQILGLLPIEKIEKEVNSYPSGRLLSPELFTSIDDALKAAAHIYRRASKIAKESAQKDPYKADEERASEEKARDWVGAIWAELAPQSAQHGGKTRDQLKTFLGHKNDTRLSRHLRRILFPSVSASEFSKDEIHFIRKLEEAAVRECATNRRRKNRSSSRERCKGDPTTQEKLVTPQWVKLKIIELREAKSRKE